MGVYIDINKFVIITEPKTTHLDLPKDVGNNFNNKIESIKNHHEFFVGHKIPNISMKTILMKTENRKTTEPHKFTLNLSQRLDLKSSNKHVAL